MIAAVYIHRLGLFQSAVPNFLFRATIQSANVAFMRNSFAFLAFTASPSVDETNRFLLSTSFTVLCAF